MRFLSRKKSQVSTILPSIPAVNPLVDAPPRIREKPPEMSLRRVQPFHGSTWWEVRGPTFFSLTILHQIPAASRQSSAA